MMNLTTASLPYALSKQALLAPLPNAKIEPLTVASAPHYSGANWVADSFTKLETPHTIPALKATIRSLSGQIESKSIEVASNLKQFEIDKNIYQSTKRSAEESPKDVVSNKMLDNAGEAIKIGATQGAVWGPLIGALNGSLAGAVGGPFGMLGGALFGALTGGAAGVGIGVTTAGAAGALHGAVEGSSNLKAIEEAKRQLPKVEAIMATSKKAWESTTQALEQLVAEKLQKEEIEAPPDINTPEGLERIVASGVLEFKQEIMENFDLIASDPDKAKALNPTEDYRKHILTVANNTMVDVADTLSERRKAWYYVQTIAQDYGEYATETGIKTLKMRPANVAHLSVEEQAVQFNFQDGLLQEYTKIQPWFDHYQADLNAVRGGFLTSNQPILIDAALRSIETRPQGISNPSAFVIEKLAQQKGTAHQAKAQAVLEALKTQGIFESMDANRVSNELLLTLPGQTPEFEQALNTTMNTLKSNKIDRPSALVGSIVLQGKTGSGKTATIQTLAEQAFAGNLVSINMGELIPEEAPNGKQLVQIIKEKLKQAPAASLIAFDEMQAIMRFGDNNSVINLTEFFKKLTEKPESLQAEGINLAGSALVFAGNDKYLTNGVLGNFNPNVADTVNSGLNRINQKSITLPWLNEDVTKVIPELLYTFVTKQFAEKNVMVSDQDKALLELLVHISPDAQLLLSQRVKQTVNNKPVDGRTAISLIATEAVNAYKNSTIADRERPWQLQRENNQLVAKAT